MQVDIDLKTNMLKQPFSRTQQGFTLIELMVVVVVVAVLMAVVLPSYTEYVNKGRRSDAMSALLDAANRQEQFMLDRNTYTTDMTLLGFDDDPLVSVEGHYTIDAVAGGTGTIASSYTLTATPLGTSAQNDDARCATFRLTSAGAKTATGTHAAACWSR